MRLVPGRLAIGVIRLGRRKCPSRQLVLGFAQFVFSLSCPTPGAVIQKTSKGCRTPQPFFTDRMMLPDAGENAGRGWLPDHGKFDDHRTQHPWPSRCQDKHGRIKCDWLNTMLLLHKFEQLRPLQAKFPHVVLAFECHQLAFMGFFAT